MTKAYRDEILENAFNCTHCGQKGISALRFKKCPLCGADAPGPEGEYVADPDHPITDDATLMKLAGDRPDWRCHFCDSRNRASETVCTCGHSREETDKAVQTIDYGTTMPTSAPDPHPNPSIPMAETGITYLGESTPAYQSVSAPSQPDESSSGITYTREPRSSGIQLPDLKAFLIVAVVIAALGVLGYLLFHTTDAQGRVNGFAWSRSISIERYETVHETGESSVPFGAYNVKKYQVKTGEKIIFETKKVHEDKTCYENLGNGTTRKFDCGKDVDKEVDSGRREAIMSDRYDYDLDKWVSDGSLNTSGSDRNPYWQQYSLPYEGQAIIGAKRVSSRSETYTVYFENIDVRDTHRYPYTTDQNSWSQYVDGGVYKIVINGFQAVVNNPLAAPININKQ